jgi:TonB family protein
MSEAWNQWEGHLVNDKLQLNTYLGGSGENAVFLANDPERELPPTAIKLVPADAASAELQLARWRAIQKLSHPNLIRLLDAGRCRLGDRDLIFAVMEYAEENLAQVVPERPLTVEETREMLTPTLNALAYLHGQGFVHGRLKPGNVLATGDQLKLASDSLCPAGESLCGPERPAVYDPPEVTGGGARTPAADVWSLGVTLTEVLTQRLPSWRDAQAEPVLPENLPAPFLEMVRGCLRREAQSRWTIANIAACLAGKPVQPPQRLVVAEKPSPQTPVRMVAAKPLPVVPKRPLPQTNPARPGPAERAPAVSSQGTSWVWRSAFPVALAVVGVAVLLAGFKFLRHPPEAQPETAAAKSEPAPSLPKPDPGSPTRASRGGVGDPGSPTRASRGGVGDPGSPRAGNRVDATAGMKPQPASLRTEVGPAADNPGPASDAGPGVVQRVLPDVPQKASHTIHGTIRVIVRADVDPSGKVAEAELDSPGPSRYFARLALEAAQKWQFVSSSQDVYREFVLNFEFRNSGIRAFATR